MCSCDLDLPEVFWETWPKARKTHTCCECGSTIDIKEEYFRISGVWNGEFDSFTMCKVCKAVFNEAASQLDCGICFGELWETVGIEFEYAGQHQ